LTAAAQNAADTVSISNLQQTIVIMNMMQAQQRAWCFVQTVTALGSSFQRFRTFSRHSRLSHQLPSKILIAFILEHTKAAQVVCGKSLPLLSELLRKTLVQEHLVSVAVD
jgi:hypothetical protein